MALRLTLDRGISVTFEPRHHVVRQTTHCRKTANQQGSHVSFVLDRKRTASLLYRHSLPTADGS